MTLAFADRGVYLPDVDAVVVADLHVGRDAASNVTLPLGERADLLDRLDDLLDRFTPAELVVAGDLLHAFDEVPPGVPDTIAAVCDRAAAADADVVVTPGNHDGMLDAALDAADADAAIRRVAEYRVGDTVVLHGHDPPETDAERYVVGHDHPAIALRGRRRPCFLRGPGPAASSVVVLPAFSRLAAGRTLNRTGAGDALSPLVPDLDAVEPVVVAGDAVLEFPPLGDLRPLL